MPELPEVEVVRRGVHAAFVGRTLSRVDVRHERAVRRHAGGPADFGARLVGRRITDTGRRGKYLWLNLDDGAALVLHLGMSGQLRATDGVLGVDHCAKHLRIRFGFTNGDRFLDFVDQRTFGSSFVTAQMPAASIPTELRQLAPDPLDVRFDAAAVARRIASSRSEVKRQLLDQTRVSGIGNIYADESLWRARVHWATPGVALPSDQIQQMLIAAADVMREAIAAGGTSFDALYVDLNGARGDFSRQLDAYGRAGLPCRRCGTAIVRERFAGRSSFRCPNCQVQAPRVQPARAHDHFS